jgi:hypothetical protein
MSKNYALAGAARRVRAMAERLPERHRPDLAYEWGLLLDSIEDCTDRQAIAVIEDWQAEMEMRLCSTMVNAPLEDAA